MTALFQSISNVLCCKNILKNIVRGDVNCHNKDLYKQCGYPSCPSTSALFKFLIKPAIDVSVKIHDSTEDVIFFSLNHFTFKMPLSQMNIEQKCLFK